MLLFTYILNMSLECVSRLLWQNNKNRDNVWKIYIIIYIIIVKIPNGNIIRVYEFSRYLETFKRNIIEYRQSCMFNEFCKSSTLNIALIHNILVYYAHVWTYFELQNVNNIFVHVLSNKFKRSKVLKVRSLII